MTIAEFVTEWNTERKANKGKWIAYGGWIEGIGNVAVKSYDGWIQIVRADCVPWKGEGPMDAPVKTVTAWLTNYLADVAKASVSV